MPDGARRRWPNPLPTVERWKIFDNLRRSVVPPALVFLLVLGWTALPGSPWLWTFFALAVSFLPVVQTMLGGGYSSFKARSFDALLGTGHSIPATAGQSLLWIAFLADQARRLLDAIVRTLSRLFVSHQNLLEWETAAATEHRLGTGIGNFFRAMWFSPAFALAVAGLIYAVRPSSLLAASPVLLAWFAGADRGLLDQPAEADQGTAAERVRAGRDPPDRAEDLALLRDLRRRRGPLAPARQLSGRLDRLGRSRGAPDLADEQGDAPPVDPGRARLRLPSP